MTQVVNGVLDWKFARCRTELLRTRSGRTIVHDLALWVKAVRAVLRCGPQHVIVGHLSQGGSFVREGFLLCLARRRGLRAVAQLHGSNFPRYAVRRRRLVRFVLRSANVALVLSRETEAAVASISPETPVRRLPNTVERAGEPAARKNVVLFAGAISKRKGADVLLRAWSMARPNGWRLLLAGPLAADFEIGQLDDSVEFVGQLRREDLLRILSTTRIAVLPSRAEAMPMFLLEAMARRVAIVASRVGGIPELLGGDGGWMVRAGDAEQLAHALHALMRQPHLVDQWASGGWRRFERQYAPEIVYKQMEEAWLDEVDEREGSIHDS
jgi:glycosyltransferase involved in cell wall biosynthesis